MIEDNQANITAYIRVLKDPTGVLWHNFIKYVLRALMASVAC
jgi:ubiquitin carboxyl-terminal hydrolase 7